MWIDSARLRIVLVSPWRAAQSCRSPCPQESAQRQRQGNRHHCLPVFDGLYLQSVGKAEYRPAKSIGFGSLSHRAGGAVASSVPMRPRESLRFVSVAHRHLSPVCEVGYASQPQRRCTALAESHQMKACASQDDSQSAVALGVGLGSLTHRGWHPSSERTSVRTLRQSYITPHCPQCPAVAALKLRLLLVTAARPSGEGNRRYAKWPSLESVAQPSALPGRLHALRAAVCAPLWLSWHRGLVRRCAPCAWSVACGQLCGVCPRPPLCFAATRHQPCALVCPSAPHGGSLSPRALAFGCCYKFSSCLRTEYGGYRPKRPVASVAAG